MEFIKAQMKKVIDDDSASTATNSCVCPPNFKNIDWDAISAAELPNRPRIMWTPLDRLGYPQYCCCVCCSCGLRRAAFIICFVSFCWGAYELLTADRVINSVFPERDDNFFIAKVSVLLLALLFILACGILLFGILAKREELVNAFLWYALLYNCIYLVSLVIFAVMRLSRVRLTTGNATCRLLAGVVWSGVYFYWLTVVNSYKV